MCALKEQRRQLQEEAYAIKLQSAWRVRGARRRAQQLKIRRQQLLEEGAALQLQASWRIKQARCRLQGLREERVQNEGVQRVQRLWKSRQTRRRFIHMRRAARQAQRLIRGAQARLRVSRLLRQHHPHNLVLSLHRAADLNVADATSSDPYVLATSHRRDDAHTLLSWARSKTIPNSLSPVWNQNLLITAVEQEQQIALTIMDSDLIGADDFMGQVGIFSGWRICGVRRGVCHDVTATLCACWIGADRPEKVPRSLQWCRGPLLRYSGGIVRVLGDGRRWPSPRTHRLDDHAREGPALLLPACALISLQVLHFTFFPSLSHILVLSMCGWMLKASTGLMTKGSMKRRWVILTDYTLHYFESPFSLHESKGEIQCAEVTSLVEETSKKDGCVWRICYGKAGREQWTVQVDPEAPPHIHRMWWRKLVRSCPQVVDPELVALNPRFRQRTLSPTGRAPPLKAAQID